MQVTSRFFEWLNASKLRKCVQFRAVFKLSAVIALSFSRNENLALLLDNLKKKSTIKFSIETPN